MNPANLGGGLAFGLGAMATLALPALAARTDDQYAITTTNSGSNAVTAGSGGASCFTALPPFRGRIS
jgi:hypothetical protein